MDRVPEPESVMEAVDSVDAFHAAGLPGGPLYPIYLFNCLRLSPLLPRGALVVDVACGPAHFMSHLLTGRSDVEAIGIDLSAPMLETARRYLSQKGLDRRVELVRGDAANAAGIVSRKVDAVVCMSALHQCHSESDLTSMTSGIRALRDRDGCAVWIFDLVRPEEEKLVELIPQSYEMFSGQSLSQAFKLDWKNSLRAGWTFAELSSHLRACDLELAGIEANNSQLHVATPRDHPNEADYVEWQGPALDVRDRRRLKAFAKALDSATASAWPLG